MSFMAANTAYEAWLRKQCDVVESDLDYKHERMAEDAFLFLRATCFRWSSGIGTVLKELAETPKVLSVGDCHLENFGTWRDQEARLTWGVNDYDEAADIPYAFDIVRLATSLLLAPKKRIDAQAAVEMILAGYEEGLGKPRPALLYEAESWMIDYAVPTDEKRQKFWKHIDELPADGQEEVPADARSILVKSLPEGARIGKFARRPKQGGGSLGRPRFVVVADWRGGRVVREAKALVPPSWDYAHGQRTAASRFLDAARGPSRAFDPFLGLDPSGKFVVRRIWPDSRKLDLGRDAGEVLHQKLLHAMGRDIGAIHADTPGAAALIAADLRARDRGWLHRAARAAQDFVEADFSEWRSRRADPPRLN